MLMHQFEDICKKYDFEIAKCEFDKEVYCWYKNSLLICYFIDEKHAAYVVSNLLLYSEQKLN